MAMNSSRSTRRNALLLGVALLVAACGGPSEPQLVRAKNPTVTYRYETDDELLKANQNAAAFCTQYNAFPQAANFYAPSGGGKQVVFECVVAGEPTVAYEPSRPRSYRSDREMVEASRDADIYCQNHGSQRAVTTISTDPNGVRTISYQCAP